jgi:hypothetical protein
MSQDKKFSVRIAPGDAARLERLLSEPLTVGQQVRVLTMSRTDAIGRIVRLGANGVAVVRLENWKADGYYQDVAEHTDNLEALGVRQ